MKENTATPAATHGSSGASASSPSQSKTEARLARLLELLRELTVQGFTGYVKINFSQGGIGRVEKFEEILK